MLLELDLQNFRLISAPNRKTRPKIKETYVSKYVNFLVKSLQNRNCTNKNSEHDIVLEHSHVIINANNFTSKQNIFYQILH